MVAKLSFTKQELIVIRESVHSITIKGSDAVAVAGVLTKIYKAIEDIDRDSMESPVAASKKVN